MISVIIPTWEELMFTAQCLSSLFKVVPEDSEVIVIDNGSLDGTVGYLEDLSRIEKRLKVVKFSENKGFAPAINEGIRNSSGSVVVIANNDVLFPDKTFERLLDCLTHSETLLGLKKVGAVGPISNKAAGVPNEQFQGSQTFENVSKFAEMIFSRSRGEWRQVGFLSGFCLAMKREFLDDVAMIDKGPVQFFDEIFIPGGWEDNDLAIRAAEKGWALVNAADTFVFHFGSKTISKFPHLRLGTANRDVFYRKHRRHEVKNEKVLIYYDGEEFPIRSIDEIGTLITAKDLRELDPGAQDLPSERRSLAYEYAIRESYAWMIGILRDEIPEVERLKEVMERIKKNPNPEAKGYLVPIIPMFDHDLARRDFPWSALTGLRIMRVEPGLSFSFEPRDIIFEILPNVPSWNRRYCGVRFFDHRFERPDWKEEMINQASRYGNPEVILQLVYDEKPPGLTKVEPAEISLSMLLGDGEADNILEFLDPLSYLVDEIVIGDTGSKDGGRSIIEEFYHWVKLANVPLDDDFAGARNKVKSLCSKQWILHLDWDETMNPGDAAPHEFREILRMTEMRAHAYTFEVVNYHRMGDMFTTDSIRLFRNSPKFFYNGRVHESFDKAMLAWGPEFHLMKAPFRIHHLGFVKGRDRIASKLSTYERLCKLDIQDDPKSPKGYYNLALHYLNDGHPKEGVSLLRKSLEVEPRYWLARKELLLWYLREAKHHLDEVMRNIPENHWFFRIANEWRNWLEDKTGDPTGV